MSRFRRTGQHIQVKRTPPELEPSHITDSVGASVGFQPVQQLPNTACGIGYIGIGGPVVEIEGVTVGAYGIAAGEDHVSHIS